MKLRRRNYKKNEEIENFWPSFTDMISTIALILFFLMLLAYIQNIITGKNLEFAKKQIIDTQKKLEESNAEISRAEKKLRLLKDKIDEAKAEVKRGEIALKLSEEQIEKQREIIAESNRELGELRTKLQGIAVLRLEVLQKVKGSVEKELGKTNERGEELVLISDNGNIIINENLVFDFGSYQLKPEGKKLLNQLAQAFERVLDDKSIRANIDAINIQGHTDHIGSSQNNRDLSAKRATAVVNYLMSSNKDLENKYGKYFAASAYSEFRPITNGESEGDRAKNRRIEISITLKDSNVQKVINDYLDESLDIFNQEN
ncbi:OmpA family protein [Paramaledivibacter caminithermalis]|jgi:chemotaxis protein MotB|uniref:Chemotaxis protein MotB n=1 Tax=Paramaledivibacter caminithermalis (strain DSM 15212 / CIP 107654 / DViRD3) TaxID=1121301 RepID=A0A1M6PS89_PARC5|nr:OmpA family protein [Paramaledivibacter caminithermalis]SHK10810.1 chemotaxis protein MotB [Paramaledivibacter caminithermalis DSM 15212]